MQVTLLYPRLIFQYLQANSSYMLKDNTEDLFNGMQDGYDHIKDLYFSWLFSRLHFLIAREVIVPIHPKKVLDVGCGTGFQSFLFASSGADVTGIDISEGLIRKANEKSKYFDPEKSINLFPAYHSHVEKYSRKIKNQIGSYNNYRKPGFMVGDALKLDFPDNHFDHVNCCGSTLNFIDNYKDALSEISRVLKPGGTFSIEMDARWNFNLFWPIIDKLLFGIFNYDITFRRAITNLFQPVHNHVKIKCPIGNSDKQEFMDIWLFSKAGLRGDLMSYGLKTERSFSIHSFTNLIPATVLDSTKGNKILNALFKPLSVLDEIPGLNKFPGCSMVLIGEKVDPEEK